MAQEFTNGIFGQGGAIDSGPIREVPVSASFLFETLNGQPLSISASVNVSKSLDVVQSLTASYMTALTASLSYLALSSSAASPSILYISSSTVNVLTGLLYDSGNLNVQGTCSFGTGNGALPVAQGGTGDITLVASGVLIGQGINPISTLSQPVTASTLVQWNGAPVFTGSPVFALATDTAYPAAGGSIVTMSTLPLAIPANSKWVVDYVFPCNITAATNGVALAFSTPGLPNASAQMDIVASAPGPSGNTQASSSAWSSITVSSINTNQNLFDWVGINTQGTVRCRLYINNGVGTTAGTVTPAFQFNSGFNVLVGSTYVAHRIS